MFDSGPMNLALRSDALLLATFLFVGLCLFGWDMLASTRLEATWDPRWLGTMTGNIKYYFLCGAVGFPIAAFLIGGLLYALYGLLCFAITNVLPPADQYWYCILAFNGCLFVLGFVLLIGLTRR